MMWGKKILHSFHIVQSAKTTRFDFYEIMEYNLAPNYILDFKDFLYPIFEDRNVTSIIFRPKYQKFMD